MLLVTSRTRGRWICPKGNVEAHLGRRGSARMEAYEEAGVEGSLYPSAVGVYQHGDADVQEVRMYLLEVEREHRTWPESDQRRRCWLPLVEARLVVDEEGLRGVLDAAERRLLN